MLPIRCNSREEIKKNPQRTLQIKHFINKYNWKGINYLSGKDDWKHFQQFNNPAIALNVLYVKK